MSDDWEDEDFVPTLNTGALKNNEDEDLALAEQQAANKASSISQEDRVAKAQKDEAAFLKKIESTSHKDETAEERRRRERRQVEEADNELTNELFEGLGKQPAVAEKTAAAVATAAPARSPAAGASASASAGSSASASAGGAGGGIRALASIKLDTNQDHFEFGNMVHVRLQDSTAFNVVAYYRGLSKILKGSNITVETLDEISNEIKKIRDAKAKNAPTKKGEAAKKTSAEIKKENKRHADIFGFAGDEDPLDHYNDMADDFM